MCHLIEHVLSEADLLRVCPNLQQEQEHSAKEVPHGLGTNNFLAINKMQYLVFQGLGFLVCKQQI